MNKLTELCQELHNWFETDKFIGTYSVAEGIIASTNPDFKLKEGQFFRIVGSTFDDGVHQNTQKDLAELHDDAWHGAIWPMAIPTAVISLATQIEEWAEKYETAGSEAMSPFASESFAGYSYSKPTNKNGSTTANWTDAFRTQLNRWRKLP